MERPAQRKRESLPSTAASRNQPVSTAAVGDAEHEHRSDCSKRDCVAAGGPDDPDRPRRHVTVLHVGPVLSAAMAVRAQSERSLEAVSQKKA